MSTRTVINSMIQGKSQSAINKAFDNANEVAASKQEGKKEDKAKAPKK